MPHSQPLATGAALRNLLGLKLAGRGSRMRLRATEHSLAQLEDTYELTVEALAAALELRDDETGSHARRVTDIALRLTQVIDPELAESRELRHGFLLHDIGKIGIPDRILLKPGPLTAAETRALEMHTTLGEQLVSSIPYLSHVAREVVAYHHERWDGSGYPWQLKGTDIPLPARIFAVADAYDAMTTNRPYRTAMEPEVALAELRRAAGSQFDPAILSAFVPIAEELASERALAEGTARTSSVSPVVGAHDPRSTRG